MLKWGVKRWKGEKVKSWCFRQRWIGVFRMRARARFLYSVKSIFYFIKYKYNTLHTHCPNWASHSTAWKTALGLTIQHFNISARKFKNSCFHLFTFSPFHLFTPLPRLITLKNKGISLYYSQLDLYDKLWFITGCLLILLLLHRFPQQERRHKSTSIVILSDFLSLSACVASSLDNNKLMYLGLV